MSYHVPPGPFATFYSSQTQAVLNRENAQAITYNITGVIKGVSLASGSRITLPQPGNYALSFSAIGHNSGSSSTRWLNIFLKRNGLTVDNSSTIVTVSKQVPTTLAATFDLPVASPGEYYELFLAGEQTDCEILATPAQAAVPGVSPAMPACPSIVVAVWQIN